MSDRDIPDSKTLQERVEPMQSIEAILKDNICKRGFRCYCYQQFNIENLVFWDQVQAFKARSWRTARKLRDTFIKENSASQVNINTRQRRS